MSRPGSSPTPETSGAVSLAGRAIRTLILTLDRAWPAISGADLRNWQNAEAASKLGPVALTSVTAEAETPPAPVEIQFLTDLRPGGVWRQAPTMAQADLLIPTEARAPLRRVISDFSPDVIVVEHPALVGLADAERPRGTRLVVDLHNIESVADARTAAAHSFLSRQRWRSVRASRASARAERSIGAVADAIWVCSGEEEARFRALCSETPPVQVVPNGIPGLLEPTGALAPMRTKTDSRIDLVFSGHLAYPPNIDAVRWLALDILPALRQSLDARLVLAGRTPAPAVQALGGAPSVRVLANPPDMTPILADADIAVMPIRLGGGTRIKVAEAMARGLPVVATRFAVEGADLVDRLHFLAAETTQEFVAAIAALAADTAERSRLRAAAWSHCQENFGPEAIARAVRAGLLAS